MRAIFVCKSWLLRAFVVGVIVERRDGIIMPAFVVYLPVFTVLLFAFRKCFLPLFGFAYLSISSIRTWYMVYTYLPLWVYQIM